MLKMLLNTRTFSEAWFWISLLVIWLCIGHRVMGVRWSRVKQARRKGGELQAETDMLVHLHVRDMMDSGVSAILTLFSTGFLAALLVFASKGSHFAQAMFLLAFPLWIINLLTWACARAIRRDDPRGQDLFRRLRLHRFLVQLVAWLMLISTTLWGLIQNIPTPVLGN